MNNNQVQITIEDYIKEVEENSLKVNNHEPIVYRVYDYMKKHHVGEKYAISSQSLCDVFNIDERDLRKIIREIRMSGQLEKIIVSSNKGYYMATEGEVDALVARLIRHGAAEIQVARNIAKKAQRDGQFKIQFGPYYKEIYESICKN